MYEITGTVKRIGDTQCYANNFSKRELVIAEPPRNDNWQNVIGFYFKRASCTELDKLSVGDEVKIGFVVEGHDWTDPNTRKTRCFTDLTGYRLEILKSSASPSARSSSSTPRQGDAIGTEGNASSPVSSGTACSDEAASSSGDDEKFPF